MYRDTGTTMSPYLRPVHLYSWFWQHSTMHKILVIFRCTDVFSSADVHVYCNKHKPSNSTTQWHRYWVSWPRCTAKAVAKFDILTLTGRLSRTRDNGNIVTWTIVTNSWWKRRRQKDWLQLLATPRHTCHSCQGSCRRVVETKSSWTGCLGTSQLLCGSAMTGKSALTCDGVQR